MQEYCTRGTRKDATKALLKLLSNHLSLKNRREERDDRKLHLVDPESNSGGLNSEEDLDNDEAINCFCALYKIYKFGFLNITCSFHNSSRL